VTTAKHESEALMNAVMPVAEKMLEQYGEFFPCGAYMTAEGAVALIGVDDPETDHPKSQDILYVLRNSLREMADDNRCKATAIVFDVTIVLPNSDSRSNAIQVCLEHVEGYCVDVFIPYELVSQELIYREIFAQQGTQQIFTQR
jgi:hypothetical protein